MSPRVLVTVSRDWSNWSVMRAALTRVLNGHPDAVLLHGDAPLGDRSAAAIWESLGGGKSEAWPASWGQCGQDCRHKPGVSYHGGRYCPYAGFRRNIAMVESAPDLVLAFIRNNSRGATHCARIAEEAGIPTVIYRQDTDVVEDVIA